MLTRLASLGTPSSLLLLTIARGRPSTRHSQITSLRGVVTACLREIAVRTIRRRMRQ